MRGIEEILDYARRAPAGEPVPIVESEIPEIVGYVQRSSRNWGGLKWGESIGRALAFREFKLLDHTVIVL